MAWVREVGEQACGREVEREGREGVKEGERG